MRHVFFCLALLFTVPAFATESRPIKPFREIKKEMRKMERIDALKVAGAVGWIGMAVFIGATLGPLIILQLTLGIAGLFLWPILRWLLRKLRRMI